MAPLVIAHRGASAHAPENTLEAFRLAKEMGADGVELDVRPTRDRTLAIVHDAALPDGRAVAGLGRVDLPETVCDLPAALDACRDLLVNVEIKNLPTEDAFDPTVAVATEVVECLSGRHGDRILVSSFHVGTVDRVRELAPDLDTGCLCFLHPGFEAMIDIAAERGHGAVHPHVSTVSPELVDRAIAAGLDVHVWTVDDPAVISELAAMGVTSVITNDVPTARAAVDRV